MSDVKLMLETAGFKEVAELTYLGIPLDSKLRMNFYVDSIAKKINQSIGALHHMKNKLPSKALLQFYFGNIHSHLSFCSFVLMRSNNADIKRLQTLQNRALKLLYNLPPMTPTTVLFETYAKNILPVKGLIYFSSLMMIKKNLINNLPDKIPMTRLRSSRHYLLQARRSSSQAMRNDICCKGIEIFNNLPNKIKLIDQFGYFKNAVKLFLLEHRNELLSNNNFLLSAE
jgi:hypothetical protein